MTTPVAIRLRPNANGFCLGIREPNPRVTDAGWLLAEKQDLRERERLAMRDRQERSASAERGESFCGAAVELEAWRASAADNLYVSPQDILRMPRAERLHPGFLGGKTPGEMNGRYSAAVAVLDFPLREDAAKKPFTVACNCGRDPIDLGRIQS